MSEDRTTIALSAEGNRIVAELVAEGWFATEIAAFHAAVAVALSHGLSIDRATLGPTTTKWNVGSLEPELRGLVQRFSGGPVDKPYEHGNVLAEAGLRHLDELLAGKKNLTEVLGLATAETVLDAGIS